MPEHDLFEEPVEPNQEELPDSNRIPQKNPVVDEGLEKLKTAWINNSPKWYARAIPGKGQLVDKLVTLRLEEFQSILATLDREDSELAHRIAELSTQLIQLNKRVVELENKLAKIEGDRETSGES